MQYLCNRVLISQFLKYLEEKDVKAFTIAVIVSSNANNHVELEKLFKFVDEIYWSRKVDFSSFSIYIMNKNRIKLYNHLQKCPLLKCGGCLASLPFENEACGCGRNGCTVDFKNDSNYTWKTKCGYCDKYYCKECDNEGVICDCSESDESCKGIRGKWLPTKIGD